jgi:NADPH-dependent curcumin reductase CurA
MINRFWQLNAHPHGVDFAAALTLEQQDCPRPQAGEVLVRNQMLSMDAGTRMWMSDRTDGYQPPLPLGSPMVGLVLGRVIESRNEGFAEGDLVRAFGSWADYSLVTPEQADLRKMDAGVADLRQHFGVLGMNGWTALWGIMETGQAKAGETVLVSAAAGSTGILACQIAQINGCKVYGIAGGPEKCRYLTETLGLDGAFDYKASGLADALAGIGGIDVYFDNVGGPILDSVLPNMAMYGRIPICGVLAGYGEKTPLAGPVNFDQILMKRLRVEGFFSPDFLDQGDRLTAQLRTWLDEGRLMLPFDETDGIENVLTAYAKLFTGENIGKVIVRLDQPNREEPKA